MEGIKDPVVNKNTPGRKKFIIILLITAVYALGMSYAINKLYTFSCFSQNDKTAIKLGSYLIDLVYSFTAAKLSGITLEDLGIRPRLFRRYLFMLLPGVPVQLLRVCLGRCTVITGVSEFFQFLFIAGSEEILMRGLVLAFILKISHSNKCAIIIQAVIFGAMHYFNASFGTLSSCVEPMVFGAIFACIRVYLPEGMGMPGAILVHWVWDMCA